MHAPSPPEPSLNSHSDLPPSKLFNILCFRLHTAQMCLACLSFPIEDYYHQATDLHCLLLACMSYCRSFTGVHGSLRGLPLPTDVSYPLYIFLF